MEKFTYDLFLQEMTENILPFWMKMIDCENGGFYGEADFYGNPIKNANKGGILCSRILWSFSAAYRMVKNKVYLDMASHAKDFLLNHFIDKDFGVYIGKRIAMERWLILRSTFTILHLPSMA